ncbi:VpsR-related response regulator [Kaarinaea lacus]
MSKRKQLLHVIAFGGYPDFTALYEQHGYQVTSCKTLRKALALVKQLSPAVIVAEFVYAPTYGSQLSNFESLLAAAENFSPNAKLIALVHQADLAHFEKVKAQNEQCTALPFPISTNDMDNCLNSIDISE